METGFGAAGGGIRAASNDGSSSRRLAPLRLPLSPSRPRPLHTHTHVSHPFSPPSPPTPHRSTSPKPSARSARASRAASTRCTRSPSTRRARPPCTRRASGATTASSLGMVARRSLCSTKRRRRPKRLCCACSARCARRLTCTPSSGASTLRLVARRRSRGRASECGARVACDAFFVLFFPSFPPSAKTKPCFLGRPCFLSFTFVCGPGVACAGDEGLSLSLGQSVWFFDLSLVATTSRQERGEKKQGAPCAARSSPALPPTTRVPPPRRRGHTRSTQE